MTESTELKLVTFDRTSARSALEKLHREVERAESTTDLEIARDHVINAFATAWHLHAWIWDAIKDRPELKDAVFQYRGIDEEDIADQSAFGAALARRFVPLKICRLTAISSNAVRIALPREAGDQSDLSTEEVGRSVDAETHALSTLSSSPSRSVPMILVMGKPVAVSRLLKEVESYWVTLIHECGLEQLR